MISIEQNENGFYFYPELPSGWKIATTFDFYDVVGIVLKNMPFLVQSFYSNNFECYRVHENFKINNLLPFINEKRVYILE